MVVRALDRGDAAFLERMMLVAGFPPDRELPADAAQLPHVRRFLAHRLYLRCGFEFVGDPGSRLVMRRRLHLTEPGAG
jgi:hypothetical protein